MQFDTQADSYDKRAGLGKPTAKKIAAAINSLITPYLDGTLLEIGAGTGEIGYYLQTLPISYTGIDLSAGMLAVYRARFADPTKIPRLLEMDANQPWPLPERSVSVFFSSRALHQLDAEHVLAQLAKLASPAGALLILGNVKRSQSSPKTIMRKEMHNILHSFGLTEKSGQTNRKQLFDILAQQGGERLPTVEAASWQSRFAPIDSLTSWESVEGIAGQAIDPMLKTRILDTLMLKAQKLFPNIHQPQETKEIYELNAITLPFNCT